MSNKTGTIFNIQRYSIYDGPGIRTTVFLKGCFLKCFWCHNPEGASAEPEIQILDFKCRRCGLCIENCPNNARFLSDGRILIKKNKCTHCLKCIKVCPSGATELIGNEVKVKEVLSIVEQDIPFYKRSDGGVTFSGGEPFLQAKFLKNCLMECAKKNIHTAVDTSGFVEEHKLKEIMPYVNLFLYDIKSLDDNKHKNATGVSNKIVSDNLKMLLKSKARVHLRIPIIPTFNDSVEDIQQIADFISDLKDIEFIEILPFHQLGSGKYKSLQKPYKAMDLKIIPKEKLEELLEPFKKKRIAYKLR